MSKLRNSLFLLLLFFLNTQITIAQEFTTPIVTEPAEGFLDVDWYHEYFIKTVNLWNGGLDGNSGMGVYSENFDGYFDVNLSRDWNTEPAFGSTTVIAHSRAIYMNVEAYRAAGSENGQRFLEAVEVGTDYLLDHYLDPDYGGFYWEVYPTGRIANNMKQGYGNVHPAFALAHAYDVTANETYLEAALDQLNPLQEKFLDPDHDGGFLPGFNRDFSQILGNNNVDSFTHYFETLLALYDVTEGDTQAMIADMIELEGNFLVNVLYNDQEGFDDRGYVAYNYDDNWQASQIPYQRDLQWVNAMHVTTGHNVELAYLLSRAVERGFSEEWLVTADKLTRFALEYAMHPEYGGMIYDTTDYDGNPLQDNPDTQYFIWWTNSETARTLIHFIIVRGRTDYIEPFLAVQDILNTKHLDTEYGGWFANLDVSNFEPQSTYKGNVWKVGYHFSMLHAEILRLNALYSDIITEYNNQ